MRYNIPQRKEGLRTHEGAPAKHIGPEARLRRSVLSCLLWEKEFYEDGEDIATRIETEAKNCSKEVVLALALEARQVFGLRHAPLALLLALVRRRESDVAEAIASTISRPDEIAELLALYWRKGKRPIANQLKKGLAAAFGKFDEYQLAKYNRDGLVKLRDALFLTHAKPRDEAQVELFKKLASGQLAVPDTWETSLSAGADKKETFERLLQSGKLGYLALLRNLRNMAQSGVDESLVFAALSETHRASRVWPFRFVAAARAVPQWESQIDAALQRKISAERPLPGRTIVLVDVSASMDCKLSQMSDLTRLDAAAALASIIPAESLRVFSFSYDTVEVPPRRGMAGIDAITRSQEHSGTYLGKAVEKINSFPHDRLIVITDEQSHDRVPDPVARRAYLINVASNRNGVGYGKWIHLDGFSEAVLKWIQVSEEPE